MAQSVQVSGGGWITDKPVVVGKYIQTKQK